MPLISIMVALIIVGVALYLINTHLPMQANIKTILNIVVVVFVCLWLLQVFGLLGSLSAIQVR